MEQGHFDSLEWVKLEKRIAAPSDSGGAIEEAGIPQAPPPDNQSPLKEARYLLRAVAEVEHALLTQYLYAAYSLSPQPASQAVKAKVIEIAKEEMGHLLCVQNLLGAVGSRPYFDRKNYPITTTDQKFYPYAFTLEPLSLDSLAKYVATESPFLELIDDPNLANRVAPVIAQGKKAAHTVINHVGALFMALYWLFKADDTPPTDTEWPKYPTEVVLQLLQKMNKSNWHVKDEDFVSEAELSKWQATSDEGWDNENTKIFVRPVNFKNGKVDRASILETLSMIAAQGEGWTSTDESHFFRFLGLFEQVKAAASSIAALDVPTNPSSAPIPAGQPIPPNAITANESILWVRLFNARYQMVLLELTLAVTLPKPKPPNEDSIRAALIDRAISTEMLGNVRKMATSLVKLRRQGAPSAVKSTVVASPSFELPREALPDREPDLWQRLKDLIEESRGLCQQIDGLPVDPGNPSDRAYIKEFLNSAAGPDADLLKLIEQAPAAPNS